MGLKFFDAEWFERYRRTRLAEEGLKSQSEIVRRQAQVELKALEAHLFKSILKPATINKQKSEQ